MINLFKRLFFYSKSTSISANVLEKISSSKQEKREKLLTNLEFTKDNSIILKEKYIGFDQFRRNVKSRIVNKKVIEVIRLKQGDRSIFYGVEFNASNPSNPSNELQNKQLNEFLDKKLHQFIKKENYKPNAYVFGGFLKKQKNLICQLEVSRENKMFNKYPFLIGVQAVPVKEMAMNMQQFLIWQIKRKKVRYYWDISMILVG